VERAYRGGLEKQFFDALYMVVELHRQLGGVDILLRGPAVTYAIRHGEEAPVQVGRRLVNTLTDPRRDLGMLLDRGVRVMVEEADLTACGFAQEDLISPLVRPVAANEIARRWGDYWMVCFL
jgi:hypothetical protein